MTTATVKAPVWTGFCNVGRHHACRGLYSGHPCPCDCHQEPDPEPVEVTVHCFFACPHVVRDGNPTSAHADMEQHYFTDHQEQIRAAVGWVTA